MEVKKLQHLKINSDVSSPFAISWSEDDKIAIVGREGISILVFEPDAASDRCKLPLKRMKVEPPDACPANHVNLSTDDLISQLQRSDAYRLILDVAVAPDLNGTSPTAAYFTCCRWSPAGSLANARCLLAGVTNLGQASLFAQCLTGWPMTCDLTRAWAEHCKGAWPRVRPTDSAKVRLRQVEERTNQLRATGVSWSPRGDRLATSQRNNDIVLYRVGRDGVARVEASFPSRLDRVTCLSFVSADTLAAGDMRGRAKLYRLSRATEETFIVPEETTSLPQEAEVTAASPVSLTIEEHDLWSDCDHMSVTHFHQLRHALVVFKGSCLVVISLDDFTLATHRATGTNITGASQLDEDTLVITSQCGRVHVLTVERGAVGELNVTSKQLTSSLFNARNCGITRSRGKAIWAVVTSTSDVSDTVPTQVMFFHLKAEGLANPVSVVLDNPSQDLSFCYDYLELIRVSIFAKTASESDPPVASVVLPVEEPDLDAASLYHLRVWRWFCKIKAAVARRQAKKDDRPFTTYPVERLPLDAEVVKVEALIVLRHLCQRLTALTTRGQAMSQRDLDSVYLMRGYLGSCRATGRMEHDISTALLLTPPPGLPRGELCQLCGQECPAGPKYEQSSCRLGHSLPRCMVSMLQVLDVPYLICPLCERIAHPSVAVSNPDVKCVFCDKTLELLGCPGVQQQQAVGH